MGGGKRKPSINKKSKIRRPNTTTNNQSLFVEGGVLFGFDSPSSKHPGKGHNSNGRSSGLKFRDSGGNGSNSNANSKSRKPNAIPFRYEYPQDISRSESFAGKKKSKRDTIGSRPDNKIVVYDDPSPSKEASEVAYNYEYTSGFVLGESSHVELGSTKAPSANVTELLPGLIDEDEEICRRLGFSDKPEAITSGAGLSSKIVQDDFSSHEIEKEGDDDSMEYGDDDNDDGSSSPKQNPVFVSIGGVRVYTQDISDSESEVEEDRSSEEGSDGAETSESDDFEDSFDFDSDTDDDVLEDYLEGIGRSSKILDSKFLAMHDIGAHQDDDSDEDDPSDEFGDTLKKLTGAALREASRKYGFPKQKLKKKPVGEAQKSNSKTTVDWSPMDDMMIVKDTRRLSAKKKHVARLPQSWPSDGRKSKRFGRFPGEKKKHRKEMIAVKCKERMLIRGVDLEKINSKLKQMVLNNVDTLAFHPMHPRDCSQVQRMAAMYRLKSVCQNSGKKRFVIVSKTRHTSMPSATDEARLKKLIGSNKDDADFLVVDTPVKVGRGSSVQNKSAKNSVNRQVSSGRKTVKRSEKNLADYANQPVSFVPSGVIHSETTIQVTVVESEETYEENKDIATSSMNVGSFEVHTKGFGSKMMAKMGYMEGEGLGKDSMGMSKPIEVIQRPKSLGLGMNFEESPSEPVKVISKPSGGGGSGLKSGSRTAGSVSARRPKGNPATMGAFEVHTKRFGSKMMAKMGFVEGMGLGRDSQGISTPLTAVKRPKARGLGAEGKRT